MGSGFICSSAALVWEVISFPSEVVGWRNCVFRCASDKLQMRIKLESRKRWRVQGREDDLLATGKLSFSASSSLQPGYCGDHP